MVSSKDAHSKNDTTNHIYSPLPEVSSANDSPLTPKTMNYQTSKNSPISSHRDEPWKLDHENTNSIDHDHDHNHCLAQDHHHHDHDHHHHNHGHSGCDSHSHSGWRAYAPHSHSLHARLDADKSALKIALLILCLAFILQLVGALIAKSSLLAVESLHSLVDGVTVLLSLLSTIIAAYEPTSQFTYGYGRSEVLSALISLIALGLLCLKLATRAVTRIWALYRGNLDVIEVNGRIVVLAESVTLVANIGMACVLSNSSSQSLNIRAVRAHVIADSFENMVVLFAGVLMWIIPSAGWIDPVLTVVVVVMLFTLNWRIARETIEVLMQAAPPGSVDTVFNRIKEIVGVVRIFQIHIWTLTTGFVVGSARVAVSDRSSASDIERVRSKISAIMRDSEVHEPCVEVCVGVDDEADANGSTANGSHGGDHGHPNFNGESVVVTPDLEIGQVQVLSHSTERQQIAMS